MGSGVGSTVGSTVGLGVGLTARTRPSPRTDDEIVLLRLRDDDDDDDDDDDVDSSELYNRRLDIETPQREFASESAT